MIPSFSPDRPDSAGPAGDLLDAQDVRLLVETGFMALMHGFVASAGEIFDGVVAARPAQEAGHLGRAMACLHGGDADGAVRILRRLPPSDAARLFLGLALHRQGEAGEARAILSEVAASAAGTPHARSADAILAGLDAEPTRGPGPRRD
ncbi:tetratricopeptide repeat protein [Methylobacterium oryzihabitans]|uniref:Tetratricopeptide repeat protein n=1 Tax=Methylobacterium oryzihabitans TaxID=2499852 RepID=A0A437NPI8_9HYPH|nr:tetratricopeptide repeat protein [Methylobacterium oryzihabitans]RVU11956.1 tetratricopeptide repeat protein [Methylobacterium oryzihabitans]